MTAEGQQGQDGSAPQPAKGFSLDAAAYVDRALACVAHNCSFAEIERQVDQARAEYDQDEAERRRIAAAEQRCVRVYRRAITSDGMVPITGYAGLGDALALRHVS